MFQSFSRNNTNHKLKLECNKCKSKPDHQFILLLCDHVICGPCLEEEVEIRENQYDGIRCPCGVVTYFKTEDSQPEWELAQQRVDKKINNISVNIHNTSSHQQERGSRKTTNRPSIGLIQSKNTTSTKNFSRINTEALGFNQSAGYEPIDQPYANLMLQQSKYPVRNKNIKGYQSRVSDSSQDMKPTIGKVATMTPQPSRQFKKVPPSATNLHFCPKFIDSQSVTEDQVSQKENVNPNKTHSTRKRHKQGQQLQQELSQPSQTGESPDFYGVYQSQKLCTKQKRKISEPNQLSSQLKSELKYLKLTHEKNLQNLERAYKRAKQKISSDYTKLEKRLKQFCLETLALGQESTQVNIGKVLSMRYETYVGGHVGKLTQDIKKYTVDKDRIPFEYNHMIRQQTSTYSPLNTSLVERKCRFTSPQPYRLEHMQTEPGGNIWTKGQRVKHQSRQVYQPMRKHYQNWQQTANENSSKLQKRGTKRKTNIVIEL